MDQDRLSQLGLENQLAPTSLQTLSMSEPITLELLWTDGRKGTLSAMETLKAYCYWKVLLEQGYSEQGIWTKIAAKVKKIGGGRPGNDSVRKLVMKIDEDPGWYPGKRYGEPAGRKPALSALSRHAIKRSAEAMKADDLEPTYGLVVARCPQAVRNPETRDLWTRKLSTKYFGAIATTQGERSLGITLLDSKKLRCLRRRWRGGRLGRSICFTSLA